jgi:cholesterol oxidase
VGSGCRLSASTSSSSVGLRRLGRGLPAGAGRRLGASCSSAAAVAAGRLPAHAAPVARSAVGAAQGGHGLYEYHHFKGLDSLTASGLGGGSLIYANVMLRKDPETFAADGLPLEPADLDATTTPSRDAARRALPVGRPHARRRARCWTPRGSPGLSAERPPLAWPSASAPASPSTTAPPTSTGPARDVPAVRRLRRRLSVRGQADRRLHLPDRRGRRGAPRAHVLRGAALDREGDGWRVRYRQHLAARGGHPEHLLDPVARADREVRADRLVLAAGTFGSTGLLLRNRAALPGLEPAPGARASPATGDLLLFLPRRRPLPRSGDRPGDHRPPCASPTPNRPSGRGFLIQDAGAPALLGVAVARARAARRPVARGAPAPRAGELFGTSRASAAMMPLLGMGTRRARRRMELRWRSAGPEPGRAGPRGRTFEGARGHARRSRAGARRRVFRLGGASRGCSSVHPLGGCAMGRTAEDGVVDSYGRVFGHERCTCPTGRSCRARWASTRA